MVEGACFAVGAAQEATGPRGDAADSDVNAPGDDDLEGRLWEQKQKLEDVFAFETDLQKQVQHPHK